MTNRRRLAHPVLLLAITVGLWPAMAQAQLLPPAFSRPIQSSFLNRAFHSCLIGNFQPGVLPGESTPHSWWIKVPASGPLTISIDAVAVNPVEESGSILASVHSADGNPLREVQVLNPTGEAFSPGAFERGTLRVTDELAGSGGLLRLDVRHGPARVAGTREAHHYRLGFDTGDAPDQITPDQIMVGYEWDFNHDFVFDGPRWLEPGFQVLYANVDQGENFRLTILNEGQVPGTVEVRSKDGLDAGDLPDNVLSIVSWGDWDLAPTVALDNVAAGTLMIAIGTNGHYGVMKTSGTDQGIYIDDCPPRPHLYQFGGFEAPLQSTRAIKFGSTLPVKFRLFDLGAVVSTAVARIAVVQLSNGVPEGTPVELGQADEGNTFRYDPVDEQYVFNLRTDNLAPGTWRIIVRLDDGTIRFKDIGIK